MSRALELVIWNNDSALLARVLSQKMVHRHFKIFLYLYVGRMPRCSWDLVLRVHMMNTFNGFRSFRLALTRNKWQE